MSHTHNIIDTDCRFSINHVTRAINTRSDKLVVVQGDHNSERFSFQVSRYIEEHDMTKCDRVEVHYTNITRNKKQSNSDVYIVEDVDKGSDLDTAVFSWLISKNATQFVGYLKFSITFICLDDNGEVSYEWSTTTFEDIEVAARLENTESVLESNPDLIESLKEEIINSIPGSGVDESEVKRIIKEYLIANPPTDGKDGDDGVSPTVTVESIEGGHRITITDVNGSTSFDILNGTDGKDGINGTDGKDGEPGYSPTVNVEVIEGGNRITITDVNGEKSIDVLNGIDGKDGQNGIDGVDGSDGYTPVKGVDYFTEADKEEMMQSVLSMLLSSAEFRQTVTDLINEINSGGSSEEDIAMLVLGGEEDESTVIVTIDNEDHPVLNTSDPIPVDDGETYAIDID